MIAHATDWTADTVGTNSASLSGSTSPDDALIVVCVLTSAPSTVVVTDNGGNAYTFIDSAAGGSSNSTSHMFYAKDANPCTAINVNAPGGGGTMATASFFTGADLTNPLSDSNAQTNASSSNPPPSNVDAVSGGCVVGTIGVGVSSRTLTLENDYTQFYDYKGGSRNMLAARKLTTANAVSAPDWVISGGSATSTYEVTAAFKPVGTSTPTPITVQAYVDGSLITPAVTVWNGSVELPWDGISSEVVP